MDFQIIQISDIHFKSKDNSVLEKKEQIFNSLKNEIACDTLILITGDSAFSGRKDEFELAEIFFKELSNKLIEYTNQKVIILTIPGNHDCQELNTPDHVRSVLLSAVQDINNTPEITILENIALKQENYFNYEKKINPTEGLIHSSLLLKVYKLQVGNKNLIINCYNTSFQSILNELPGKMIFPHSLIADEFFKQRADIIISCFHHPLHWLNPESNRSFKNLVNSTSDFCFTGHEHLFTKSEISDLEDNFIYYIEGDVLQDSDNKNNSGFNLINLNLEDSKFEVKNFKWRGDSYKYEDAKWKDIRRGGAKLVSPYKISRKFLEHLNDIGANFSHPNIDKVALNDIYVFPNLEKVNLRDETNEDVSAITINSSDVLSNLSESVRVIISGSENIGKTSLLKMFYKKLHNLDYIPISIEGHQITSTDMVDLNKLLGKEFIDQYISNEISDFNEIDRNKLVIIIDDFNRVKLNIKYKAKFLSNLNSKFPNIIISGNELMSVEDIVMDESLKADLYSSFIIYEIKEFGHSLRGKLINKWNTLGIEATITDEERIRKLNEAENVINTITGINFVPCYPFFILTILQSIEIGNPTDLSASTFGHYYQFLIQKSFTSILKSQREITEYENYLSELAFYLYKKILKELDIHELEKFDASYRRRYTITHTLDKIVNNLVRASVFDSRTDQFNFKYSYLYYYFVSSYLANHITEGSIRIIVEEMTDKLHISENSNILMFLTHHSKDRFLLNQLLEKAKSIFSGLLPCKLEQDINAIDGLTEKMPDLVFESRTVDEYREEENKSKDQIVPCLVADQDTSSPNHDLEDLNIVSRMNVAFKAIEIIGQILKNNYGKIDNTTIENLIQETILVGLRSLRVFFEVIEGSSEFVVNQVNAIIDEIEKNRGRKLDNPKKIEQLSKNTVFNLCTQMSYVFIKKISDSIGTEYLNDLLENVYQRQDYVSVKLLRLAIKLDHYRSFPDSDLRKLNTELDSNFLAIYVMKKLVINHLYLYPINHTHKSQVLAFLKIPMKTQLRIDQTSKVRKK